eukprot:g1816.t1
MSLSSPTSSISPQSCSASACNGCSPVNAPIGSSVSSHSSTRDPRFLAPSATSAPTLVPLRPSIDGPAQYFESLRGRRLRVFSNGSLLPEPLDHPLVAPSVRAVAVTYQLGLDRPDLAMAVEEGYR